MKRCDCPPCSFWNDVADLAKWAREIPKHLRDMSGVPEVGRKFHRAPCQRGSTRHPRPPSPRSEPRATGQDTREGLTQRRNVAAYTRSMTMNTEQIWLKQQDLGLHELGAAQVGGVLYAIVSDGYEARVFRYDDFERGVETANTVEAFHRATSAVEDPALVESVLKANWHFGGSPTVAWAGSVQVAVDPAEPWD